MTKNKTDIQPLGTLYFWRYDNYAVNQGCQNANRNNKYLINVCLFLLRLLTKFWVPIKYLLMFVNAILCS